MAGAEQNRSTRASIVRVRARSGLRAAVVVVAVAVQGLGVNGDAATAQEEAPRGSELVGQLPGFVREFEEPVEDSIRAVLEDEPGISDNAIDDMADAGSEVHVAIYAGEPGTSLEGEWVGLLEYWLPDHGRRFYETNRDYSNAEADNAGVLRFEEFPDGPGLESDIALLVVYPSRSDVIIEMSFSEGISDDHRRELLDLQLAHAPVENGIVDDVERDDLIGMVLGFAVMAGVAGLIIVAVVRRRRHERLNGPPVFRPQGWSGQAPPPPPPLPPPPSGATVGPAPPVPPSVSPISTSGSTSDGAVAPGRARVSPVEDAQSPSTSPRRRREPLRAPRDGGAR